MLAALLSGCSDDENDRSPRTAGTGCTEEAVAERISDFAGALRDADIELLSEIWGERFRWFSETRQTAASGGDEHFVARSPRRATEYVRRREGLPIDLTHLWFDEPRAETTHVGFAYFGRWDSGGDELPYAGKGDLLCDSPEIRVWSATYGPDVRPPGRLRDARRPAPR